ncbi:alpha/beta fold hydrolase [Actinoplanes sp. NPDC049265]|uniref:alpha/beta fold hydrolase n=1 Tax=Actinoplanes sp. NPDC049265 TaxID=3363902 RepID=UPI00371E8213
MPTITLADGRAYAFEEWGDPGGRLLFWMYGAPGGRLARHSEPKVWERLGLRVVTLDRPGYGRSAELPGRLVAHIASDVAAVADHLGVDRFAVQGLSAGGPYALATAARLGDRVAACSVVCTVAPLDAAEEASLSEINRESFRIVREEGRTGIARRLEAIRGQMLADAERSQRTFSADTSPEDLEWLSRPEVQQIAADNIRDSLRDGVTGWADDVVALAPGQAWGFDPASIGCPTRFWHSADDPSCPLPPARRLADSIPDAAMTIWYDGGHTTPSRNAEAILTDLLGVWR